MISTMFQLLMWTMKVYASVSQMIPSWLYKHLQIANFISQCLMYDSQLLLIPFVIDIQKDNEKRRFQFHLKSTNNPIYVTLVNKESDQTSPLVVRVPPPKEYLDPNSQAMVILFTPKRSLQGLYLPEPSSQVGG